MYKFYFFLPLLFFSILSPQTYSQKLAFGYDTAGNQIERRYVCVNCRPADSIAAAKLAEELDKKNTQNELTAERSIKVYPNPVSEVLTVNWNTPEALSLTNIEVFNVLGARLFSMDYNPGQQQAKIPFANLPSGTYFLIGHYSDSKTETIKLVKK